MQVQVKEKMIEKTGMEEGQHHLFRCSSCDAPLADIMVNYAGVDAEWNIVVECCHCGDKSYQQTVKGKFLVGRTEEVDKYTRVIDYDMSKDPMVIKTAKVADYVQKRSR